MHWCSIYSHTKLSLRIGPRGAQYIMYRHSCKDMQSCMDIHRGTQPLHTCTVTSHHEAVSQHTGGFVSWNAMSCSVHKTYLSILMINATTYFTRSYIIWSRTCTVQLSLSHSYQKKALLPKQYSYTHDRATKTVQLWYSYHSYDIATKTV